jgi:hypothetical protein
LSGANHNEEIKARENHNKDGKGRVYLAREENHYGSMGSRDATIR